MSGYAAIVADPPWKTTTGPMSAGGMGAGFVGGSRASQPLAYPTMSVAEICALPVGELAAPDAHLWLWATSRYLPRAFEIVDAWGFKYSTTCVWAKRRMGGGLGGTYRISTEYYIYARRGKPDTLEHVSDTWFQWKRPYDSRGKPQHSAKPPEFFAQVERVSSGPYLNVFARRTRPGWHVWGNELPPDVSL